MTKPETIEAYIASAPDHAKAHLEALHACLTSVAPDARQGIKWNQPAYTENRVLFMFSAHKNHLGFAPTPTALRGFAEELEGYETGKGTIKFPYDQPLPLDLIRRIAEFRLRDVRENDAKWM